MLLCMIIDEHSGYTFFKSCGGGGGGGGGEGGLAFWILGSANEYSLQACPKGGGGCDGPFWKFFCCCCLLACLLLRLVMYEDTPGPLPGVWKIDPNF